MNWLDMEGLQYSIDEHRSQLQGDYADGRALQILIATKIGSTLSWAGNRLIKWGHSLQAKPPTLDLQNSV